MQRAVKRWTLESIAREPRWPLTRTMAVPGQVRGNALRHWGVHVKRQFGASAPDRVRATMGMTADAFPDEPDKRHWFPVHAQVRLVQTIVDEFLGGDALKFETVFSDTAGAAERVLVLAGRMAGPAMVLRMAGSYHTSVCTVGTCAPKVEGKTATVDFVGAEVFDDPSWRFAQMMGMKSMFSTLGRRLDVIEGEEREPQQFAIHMAWGR